MRSVHALASLALTFGVVACAADEPSEPDLGPRPERGWTGGPQAGAAPAINPRLLRRFRSARAEIEGKDGAPSERQVELGRKLYFDKRLSQDRDLSCDSCHTLSRYGVDGERTSPGHRGLRGKRNSPSVFHAAGHLAQFWDGRAADVEQQAKHPIVNPIEMAMLSPEKVVAVLKSIPGYVEEFAAAFPDSEDAIDYDNIGRAIGAFERRLITRSRWDRFLDGDRSALTAQEVDGLKLFADIGCVQCHTGEYLGGSMFQKVGAAEPWPNQTDQGRFEVTRQEADRMQFKVPSLRNVAMTAPYFHDGSAARLEDAVAMMGRYQLGAPLQPDEVASIVAWMQSLTGELPARYLTPPELPPDGPRTAAIATH